jgi:site-specific DNA recombinase
VYLRRSTDHEHQPFSISAQEASLGSYVNSQPGWILTATFTDDASGATTDRPGLQQALRAAHAGRFDVLLVYRVDRFSRRLSDLLDLLNELEDAGWRSPPRRSRSTPPPRSGRMLVQLLGGVRGVRTRDHHRPRHQRHGHQSQQRQMARRLTPLRYHVDPGTQRLVPHPGEAPHLREIFRLFTTQRLGTRAIADELNKRGVANRTGKPWSGHTINRIIANPAYTGDIAYGDVYAENSHEPLIDRDTWHTACAIATARTETAGQRAMSDSDYQLTGLITCPACGHKYIGTAATGRNRVYRYYTCFSRAR